MNGDPGRQELGGVQQFPRSNPQDLEPAAIRSLTFERDECRGTGRLLAPKNTMMVGGPIDQSRALCIEESHGWDAEGV